MKIQSMSTVDDKTELPTYTIYKINVLNRLYVGSTSNFGMRISQHISRCHNPNRPNYNISLYKHIRELEEKGEFVFDESCFEIIEEIKNCDKKEILYCEKGWIEFYKEEKFEMLNRYRPIRTEEERKEYNKKYHESEKMKENNKKYNQSEKRKEYMREYMKKYNQSEKKKENSKKFREENRDEINRKQRERYAKKKAEKQN